MLDLPLPNLPGPFQVQNAGAAIAALRALGKDAAACEAAVTTAYWPARMQRLRVGPLVDSAPGVELWLDGGHNPAGGAAVAATLARMPARETHLICGMLNTKDVRGYMQPLAPQVRRLHAVSIPGEKNTLPADVTRDAALSVGMDAVVAGSVAEMFGVRWQAMLQGVSYFGHQLGSFAGALGGGLLYDALGSYELAWRIGVALGLAAGLVQIVVAAAGRPPAPGRLAAA